MSKKRSDSKIDGLPQHQREALEGWLFNENLSYAKCVERLWQDFSVRSSADAVGRFYQSKEQARMLANITSSAAYSKRVESTFRAAEADYSEPLLRMVGKLAFDSAVDGKRMDPELIYNFTKLVLGANAERIKNDLKRQEISLAREKFEFDAAKACLKKLPELKEISADNSLDEDAKLLAVRRELFGRSAIEAI